MLLLSGCASEKFAHMGNVQLIAQQVSFQDTAPAYCSRLSAPASASDSFVPRKISTATIPLRAKSILKKGVFADAKKGMNLHTAAFVRHTARASVKANQKVQQLHGCLLTLTVIGLTLVLIILYLLLKSLGVNPGLTLLAILFLAIIAFVIYMHFWVKKLSDS